MDNSLTNASKTASLTAFVLLLAACSQVPNGCQNGGGCQTTMANPATTSATGGDDSSSNSNDEGYLGGGYSIGSVASNSGSGGGGSGGAGSGSGGSGGASGASSGGSGSGHGSSGTGASGSGGSGTGASGSGGSGSGASGGGGSGRLRRRVGRGLGPAALRHDDHHGRGSAGGARALIGLSPVDVPPRLRREGRGVVAAATQASREETISGFVAHAHSDAYP
jgi:hypothetical protein